MSSRVAKIDESDEEEIDGEDEIAPSDDAEVGEDLAAGPEDGE